MAVKGRVTKDGTFLLAGDVQSRLPVITESLVASYPFDATTSGIYRKNETSIGNNILDPYGQWNAWTTGTQGYFLKNGSDDERNRIIESFDPFGERTKVWQAVNIDATSNADGGWVTDYISIDNTKTYRFTCWIKRSSIGDGNTYFGCYGYDSSNVNIGVKRLDITSGTIDMNPYFWITGDYDWGSILNENQWYLFVGHVHPVGYTGGFHPDSGVYDLAGNKYSGFRLGDISRNLSDFIWNTGTVKTKHRVYLYYSTNLSTRQEMVWPRLEIVDDGAYTTYAPTIQDLLDGRDDALPINTTSDYVTTEGLWHDIPSENIIPEIEAHPSYSVPGSYQPGWDNDMHPEAIIVSDSSWFDGYNSGVTNPDKVYHAQWIYDPDDYQKPVMFFRNEGSPYGLDYPPIGSWKGIHYQIPNSVRLSLSVGDTLTCSWDQKTDTIGKASHVIFYGRSISTGAYTTFASIYTNEYEKTNEWKRWYLKLDIGSNIDFINGYIYVYFYGYDSTIKNRLWIRRPQIELNKTYPTAYHIGERTITTQTRLPVPGFDRTEGTLSIDIIDRDYTPTSGNLDIVDTVLNTTGTDRFIMLRKSTGSNKINQLYIRNGSSWVTYNIPTSDFNLDEKTTFTFTWKNGGVGKIYINGAQKGGSFSYTTGDRDFDHFLIKEACVLKGLHYYNRQLTDDEVKQLDNGVAKVDTEGNLRCDSVVSRPIIEDYGIVHFPLRENGYDVNGVCGPVDDVDIYDEYGAYTGSSYTNEAVESYQDRWINSGGYEDLSDMERLHPDSPVLGTRCRISGSIGHVVGGGYDVGLTSTSKYSCSIWVWVDAPNNFTSYFYVREFSPTYTNGYSKSVLRDDDGKIYFGDLPQKRWIRLTANYIVPDIDTTGVGISYYLNNEGEIVYTTKISIVDNSPSFKPYVPSTMSDRALKYNLNKDFGISWAKSWTISYWKMPLYDQTGQQTEYNIETLGWNGGTSDQYHWFGKPPGVDSIVANGTTFLLLNPTGYWFKWQFVTLVYDESANTLTTRVWLDNGSTGSNVRSINIVNNDNFVSTYSPAYDMMLGGWSSSLEVGSIYRDLIVIKGYAKTLSELTALRNTTLRMDSYDGVNISRQIISGGLS